MTLDGTLLQAVLALGGTTTLTVTASLGRARRPVVDLELTGGLSEATLANYPGAGNLRPCDFEYVFVLGLQRGAPTRIREVGIVSLDHEVNEDGRVGCSKPLRTAIGLRPGEDQREIRIPASWTLQQGIPLSATTVPFAVTQQDAVLIGPVHYGFDPNSWNNASPEVAAVHAKLFCEWERKYGIPAALGTLTVDSLGRRYRALERDMASWWPWGARTRREPLSHTLGYPDLGRRWRPGCR